MPFCSNCGTELRGGMKFCSNCGYKIEDDELEMIEKSSATLRSSEKKTTSGYLNNAKSEDADELKKAEVIETPAPPSERVHETSMTLPTGAKRKTKTPKSTTCVVCGTKTDDICYFCDYAICKQDSLKMQIFADKSKFGNVIESCPKCAGRKKGRQPTKEEAEGIGFFFNIKPYHEWKILD